MYPSKPKLSVDLQEKTSSSSNDPESIPRMSYAIIESEPDELEHIIDLLRQFFPRTKIVEYKSHPRQSSSSEIEEQFSSNLNSPTFKGKVKDYLQRRYAEQMDDHLTRKETLIKSRSLDSSARLIKRNSLQCHTIIDLDETDEASNQLTTKTKHVPSRYPYLLEQEQEQRTAIFPSRIPLPLTPYSVSSDPGPFHSPWLNTPTSTFNFRFPVSQEPAVANAQGSIAQLSSLTKMLCDEPSVFTPITPRFKTETTSIDSSSIPPCQICREEFDSHQMYLNHYRQHLEATPDDDKVDTNLRHYSCEICSKRFSRSDMLNRHLRLHSGVRPYRCPMCNTNFSRSDHLSTHLRTHTGEKPYTCPHCTYAACRRDMITRHLKIHRKQRTERKNATSTHDSEK